MSLFEDAQELGLVPDALLAFHEVQKARSWFNDEHPELNEREILMLTLCWSNVYAGHLGFNPG